MPGGLGGLGQIMGQGSGAGVSQGSLPSWANILLPSLFGLGTAGNIFGDIQKMQEQKRLADYQKSIMGMSPQTLSRMVASATAPLSHGLEQAVGNEVQGATAERGLAQAPGIYSANLAQSLAPYYQQNQQQALQEVMQKLQLPLESTPPSFLYGQPQDMTNLLMAWLRNMGGGGTQGGQGGGGGGYFNPPGTGSSPFDWWTPESSGIGTTTPTFPTELS